MRIAGRMTHFPPTQLATTLVTLNRCQYAQLAQQPYNPPKGYPLPPLDSSLFKASELGLKLAAGFEIAYARGLKHASASEPSVLPSSDARGAAGAAGAADNAAASSAAAAVSATGAPSAGPGSAAAASGALPLDTPAWRAYVAKLEAAGFFEGNIAGSARYNEKLKVAADNFRRSAAYQASTEALAAPALRIREILAQPPDAEAIAAASKRP